LRYMRSMPSTSRVMCWLRTSATDRGRLMGGSGRHDPSGSTNRLAVPGRCLSIPRHRHDRSHLPLHLVGLRRSLVRIACAHNPPLPRGCGLSAIRLGRLGWSPDRPWQTRYQTSPSDGGNRLWGSFLILRAQPDHNAGSTRPQGELCVPACRDSFEVGLVDVSRPIHRSSRATWATSPW
jgi:hypothetical protein